MGECWKRRMNKREKLFIFDIGGVFVKLDPASRDNAISMAGNGVTQVTYADVPEAIFQDFRLGRSEEADYVRALADFFAVRTEAVYAAEHAYVAEGFSDFIAFVRALKARHRVICLSNNQPIHWRYISDNLLGHGYFDREYLSQHMGMEKPDETIFRAVEAAEQCAGKDVFFIDDIEENITAARRAGWRNCIVHHGSAETVAALDALAGGLNLN